MSKTYDKLGDLNIEGAISASNINDFADLMNSGCILDEHETTFFEYTGAWYAEIRATDKVFAARGTRDLRINLKGIIYSLDCTTGQGQDGRARTTTPIITGTSTNEQVNFFTIVESGGLPVFQATASPVSDEPFAWVGAGSWFDGTYTTVDGPWLWQNYVTSLVRNGEDRGAISILSELASVFGTQIAQGLTGSVNINGSSVKLSIGAGQAYQAIIEDIDALTDANEYYILNSHTGNIEVVGDLNEIELDANGNSLKSNNDYFAFEFCLLVNSSGIGDRIGIWLPSSSYNNHQEDQAIHDSFGYSQTPSPSFAFRRVAVRIGKVLVKYQNGDVYTNVYNGSEVEDRRGAPLGAIGGGGGLSGSNVIDDKTLTGAGTIASPYRQATTYGVFTSVETTHLNIDWTTTLNLGAFSDDFNRDYGVDWWKQVGEYSCLIDSDSGAGHPNLTQVYNVKFTVGKYVLDQYTYMKIEAWDNGTGGIVNEPLFVKLTNADNGTLPAIDWEQIAYVSDIEGKLDKDATILTDGDDLNNYVAPGRYGWYQLSTVDNVPAGNYDSIMEVFTKTQDDPFPHTHVTQVVYCGPISWIRIKDRNGTWSAWNKQASQASVDSKADQSALDATDNAIGVILGEVARLDTEKASQIDLNATDANVTTNTNSINGLTSTKADASALVTTNANVSANASAIQLNTNGLSTLGSSVSTNTANISTLSSSKANLTDLDPMNTAISNNANNIVSLGVNKADKTTLDTTNATVTSLAGDVGNNSSAITSLQSGKADKTELNLQDLASVLANGNNIGTGWMRIQDSTTALVNQLGNTRFYNGSTGNAVIYNATKNALIWTALELNDTDVNLHSYESLIIESEAYGKIEMAATGTEVFGGADLHLNSALGVKIGNLNSYATVQNNVIKGSLLETFDYEFTGQNISAPVTISYCPATRMIIFKDNITLTADHASGTILCNLAGNPFDLDATVYITARAYSNFTYNVAISVRTGGTYTDVKAYGTTIPNATGCLTRGKTVYSF